MYLSAREIEEMDGVRKVHYLNPAAERLNKSLGDAVGMQHLGAHLITVDPGHQSTDGGEQLQPIGPGDFIGCPANGIAHELINDGDEPLVCLVVGQRLTHDVVDYPRLEKRLFRNAGEWNLVDQGDIEHVKR